MIIDARRQFEKEPKALSKKRNRMTDAHRQWIEERYRGGWKPGYADEHVKIFRNTAKEKDFAYHKVSVVFWQTDPQDQPAIVTEHYEKAFTAANIAKEQAFYDSELKFTVRLIEPETGLAAVVAFTLAADDSFTKVFEAAVREAFGYELEARTEKLTGAAEKPIIRWEDSPQLGYEILPNKYFYRYEPPTPTKALLDEFWRLEKEAERMLELLAGEAAESQQ